MYFTPDSFYFLDQTGDEDFVGTSVFVCNPSALFGREPQTRLVSGD